MNLIDETGIFIGRLELFILLDDDDGDDDDGDDGDGDDDGDDDEQFPFMAFIPSNAPKWCWDCC